MSEIVFELQSVPSKNLDLKGMQSFVAWKKTLYIFFILKMIFKMILME